MPGHSVLQFPVAELEPVVRARHEHYDADYVSADPAFTHAHITALGPFLTPDEMTRHNLDLVASVVALTTPFAFTLERVGVFPNGIVHLLPEPAAPFRRVTDQLCAAFPDKPPYAAQFPAVTAHLTLDAVSATVSLVSTRRLLGGLVPARCRADRLDLAWYEPGNCHLVTSWRLGAPG
ncbi:2'-5' RNA ligase family protein [Intrasporangium sp.]|uniref:2'-5' RNA ligase family protein n=1 Tax=Intrasporangium sp. TaxID=1925024 RepID=UPI00322145F8